METRYDSFIELAPGYESVVDIHADADVEFWSRYIVNEDMVSAVKTISKTLRPNNPQEDVWHIWLKGSYGTGKTYSAIVIKHLLEDDYDVIEKFLSKNTLFADVKDKYLGIRKKGPFYVEFRSGECLQLNTSNKFLLQVEKSIRNVLKTNGFDYTGRKSLVETVQATVKSFKSTLNERFDEGDYAEYWATYDSFEDFYDLVSNGDIDACSAAQEILIDMNIGLATDLETFKAWVADVFQGNPKLAETGIFIIWDEFTEYIRKNDLDIIQQLSLFAKEQPLYIIYVMHEYPGLFSEDVSANLGKADARFNQIEIALSDKTTRKLIGESIITRDGMKGKWSDLCDDLYATISDNLHAFMSGPDDDVDAAELKKIFPIHPMTVELVSKVAGLAASNRSIFKFLKSNDDDGFRAYIKNNGFNDWKWVTADYLWDYYFVDNSGGEKTLTKMAEDCLKHYNKVASQITDVKALRVFKASMLLLATIGSGQSMKKSRGGRGIQATQKTLENCFCGSISKQALEDYLKVLSSDPINVLVFAPDLREGYRIELPYSSAGGELEAEIESIKNAGSISKLFDSDRPFGAEIKKQFAPDEKAVVKRLIIDTTWGTTQQITYKYGRLSDEVKKTSHKFGLLIVAASTAEEISKATELANNLLSRDETKRMIVCVLKHCLKQEEIEQWYNLQANASLAQKANNTVNANSFKSQAGELVSEWVSPALAKDIDYIYAGKISHVYSNKQALSSFEKTVFNLFPFAPESIIKKNTLYKSVSPIPAYYGVSKTTLTTKSAANDKQKNFNQQWQDVVDILQDNGDEDIWNAKSIDEIISMDQTKVGRSMSALCSFVNREMTNGTAYLSDLWDGLQRELGYYDTSVCCYLLGFVFRFFIGQYTWFDGNNAHRLDEETIPAMIVALCANKATGMKISSESDIEKRFKSISQRVFGLSQEEAGDVIDCRKHIKVNITKTGYPFWTLKYLDEQDYQGVREEISSITEMYQNYILEVGNQNNLMEDIVNQTKEKAKVIVPLLHELFSNKTKLSVGIKNFIFSKEPKTNDICEQYHFNVNNLVSMMARSLEEEIWQWREEEVGEAIHKLLLDMRLIGIINEAIDGNSETIEKIRDVLSNYLGYMVVPGSVYEEIEAPWVKSISLLYDISINKWVGMSENEKEGVIEELEKYAKEAVENVENPVMVLKHYIQKKGLGAFSDGEYEDILKQMPKEPFTQTENNFKSNLKNRIRELDYSKKVNTLKTLWKAGTSTDSYKEWLKTYRVPAVWVDSSLSELFSVLAAVETNERVDLVRLENAITLIQNADMRELVDAKKIADSFIEAVSSNKYNDFLTGHVAELQDEIVKKGHKNVHLWPGEITGIRSVVENYIASELKTDVSNKAKSKANSLSEAELRAKLEALFDDSPEASLLFIQK